MFWDHDGRVRRGPGGASAATRTRGAGSTGMIMAAAAAAFGLGGVDGALTAGGGWSDPWWTPSFDPTLGYEGEGPGGRITVATINPTSWNAQAHNLLMTPAHLLLIQETRIAREDRLRGARAAARREAYWGHWTMARKTAAAGSGGLATLSGAPRPYRAIKPEDPGPHWLEGRWSHTAVWVDQEVLHVINVYGWPMGTPDHKARQAQMWAELFGYIAGLGRAPWIAAGDWNAEPQELWANVVVGRTGGVLVGDGQPTCYPEKGAPRRLDYFLVGQPLAG